MTQGEAENKEPKSISALSWVHKNGGLFPAAVLAIEHNLDMIKSADYIIYLDPEGGNEGDG